ncbi:MAG: hypothetical protein ACN4G0_02090 [Polyangiales bacterium]
MHYLVFFISAFSLIVCACAETGDAGGGAGNGGNVDPGIVADHQDLGACADDLMCPGGFAQLADGGDQFALRDLECVLTSLRDRFPGVYRVELDDTHAQGTEVRLLTFVITPSGAIEAAVMTTLDTSEGEHSETYLPTERCEPKPPAFFEACLDEVRQWEQFQPFDCVFPAIGEGPPTPWFDNCVEQSPSCE